MAIIKDDEIAVRKYYPIADIVIVIFFLLANVFVVMGIVNAKFIMDWAAQLEPPSFVASKFIKQYPGFYFVFQNLCQYGFWIVNDMPHELATWLADTLSHLRLNYPVLSKNSLIVSTHKYVGQFAKFSPNLILQFPANKIYIYSMGEIIICVTAIVYGLIARLIIKMLCFLFKKR